MRINIYYGGRGLIEDPTISVINRITTVLEEIRVKVKRYNLYEEKDRITMLPNTLKDVDGIILATTVEWMGIGGLMQMFLDACWLYADKEKLSKVYMLPIAMSNTYGEREAKLTLIKAWELLGGIPCSGFSAFVEETVEFETNQEYGIIIERKAEDFYRAINQNTKILPASNTLIKQKIFSNNSVVLTPQESEQLSKYASDGTYVKKQKEDIEELTELFKNMMDNDSGPDEEFIKNLRDNFHPLEGFSAKYSITIIDTKKTIIIEINNKRLKCYYGEPAEADVIAKTSQSVMRRLVLGRITFQGAFMSGDLTAKGNFKTLRAFDQVFQFNIL